MLQDEVYRISRGVIRNAFAHAAAAHIEVEIRYDQDQLRLRVRDDGKESIPSCWRPGDSKDTLAYPACANWRSESGRGWNSGAK